MSDVSESRQNAIKTLNSEVSILYIPYCTKVYDNLKPTLSTYLTL